MLWGMAVHFLRFSSHGPSFTTGNENVRKRVSSTVAVLASSVPRRTSDTKKKKRILVTIKRSDKQARRWESWQQLGQCRGMPLPRGPHRTPVVLCRRIAPPSFISCHSLQVDRRHNCVSRRVFTKPHEPVIRCFSSDGNTVLHTLPYHCSPVPKTF